MVRRADGSVMRRFGWAVMAGAMLALPAAGQTPPAANAPPAILPPAGPPAVPVTVTTVGRGDVPILLRNIGAVQAMQVALMRSRVDGTLEKVFFQEGQEVKRGEPLALIDPRPYQAALDQASASARRTRRSLPMRNSISPVRSNSRARNRPRSKPLTPARRPFASSRRRSRPMTR